MAHSANSPALNVQFCEEVLNESELIGSPNVAPQINIITMKGALMILYAPLQPYSSIRSCNEGPMIKTPMLPPTETIPTANDCHLRKFLAVMRK